MKLLQIHPTLACNRQCSFCSYRDEATPASLTAAEIIRHVKDAHALGCRTAKVSGGGEPLCHPHIESILSHVKAFSWRIEPQTNGDLLNRTHRHLVDDIRVSVSDERPFAPPVVPVDGFCYVVTARPVWDNLRSVIDCAGSHGCYVKVMQDNTDLDNVPAVEEIRSHIPNCQTVTLWDVRDFRRGYRICPSASDSPLLGADGWLYPCCRTQYTREPMNCYNREMRLGQELPVGYYGSECLRCYCTD